MLKVILINLLKVMNLNSNKWKKLLIVLAVATGVLFVNYGYKANKPICPNDFPTSEERVTTTIKWIDDFYNNNPNASVVELSKARVDFYIKHNCKEALQRFEDYMAGNTDKETK